MNQVDYDLLASKNFVEAGRVNEMALMISAVNESLTFYAVLLEKEKPENEIKIIMEELSKLRNGGSFIHFHLRTQKIYGDLTGRELDDLYVASLSTKTLAAYSKYFCNALGVIDNKFRKTLLDELMRLQMEDNDE